MVQIISDKPSNWLAWICEVVEYLEKFSDISKMAVVACDDNGSQIIQFMNCSTDDVYYLGGVLQKEAVKHEMAEEFGFDDDDWEIEEE